MLFSIYILYFDGGCQPCWIWGQEGNTKTRIIFVCHVIISMEKDNSFVFMVHQVPDILHLMTFHD